MRLESGWKGQASPTQIVTIFTCALIDQFVESFFVVTELARASNRAISSLSWLADRRNDLSVNSRL
jgi:hypothetical protein